MTEKEKRILRGTYRGNIRGRVRAEASLGRISDTEHADMLRDIRAKIEDRHAADYARRYGTGDTSCK